MRRHGNSVVLSAVPVMHPGDKKNPPFAGRGLDRLLVYFFFGSKDFVAPL